MIEEGRVIEVKGDIARVQIQRHTSCGTCRACWMVGEGKMMAEAENSVGAAVGQKVKLQIKGSILKAAFTVYILPLLALVFGYAIGSSIAVAMGYSDYAEKIGIVLSLVSLGLAFFGVRWYGRRSGENYQIEIVQVIK